MSNWHVDHTTPGWVRPRSRCAGCHTTGTKPHRPFGQVCDIIATERRLSQSDA